MKVTPMQLNKKIFLRTGVIFILLLSCLYEYAWPRSTPHHIYNMSRRLVEAAGGPLYGIFVAGPRNVKIAYIAEVREQEKPEKRGKLRYKVFGIWRAPGEEIKGVIDGITHSVSSAGRFCKEFISIFFGD